MPGNFQLPGILPYYRNEETTMTEIVIQGIGGRMGHVLCDMIAQREDCRVVAGIDMKDGEQNGIPVYDSLEKLNGKGDVIIDFSSPAAVEKALPYCQTHKLPIVVCTTGLSEELQLKVVQLSRSVPVFKSANMSMGINVLAELCKRASAVLGINYDIEIVEQHHHNKLDAPSGTALMLADAINEQNDGAYHYVYDRSSVRQKRDPKYRNNRFPSYRYTCLKYIPLPLYNDKVYVHFLIHYSYTRNAYSLHYKSLDILCHRYLQTLSYLKAYPQSMHYHPDNKMQSYFLLEGLHIPYCMEHSIQVLPLFSCLRIQRSALVEMQWSDLLHP